MSYKTYTTEALVCGTFDRNTADRSFLLFTKEAGMLYADARSVREERSRQRYALTDFSLIRVSLIKGKAGWKIGSIEAVTNYYQSAVSKEARGSVVGLLRLVRRLVKGEEAHPELFDVVTEALAILQTPLSERVFVETAIQVRVMSLLGYIDSRTIPPEILAMALPDLDAQANIALKKRLDAVSRQALQASHL